jgi:hypothetical protein
MKSIRLFVTIGAGILKGSFAAPNAALAQVSRCT